MATAAANNVLSVRYATKDPLHHYHPPAAYGAVVQSHPAKITNQCGTAQFTDRNTRGRLHGPPPRSRGTSPLGLPMSVVEWARARASAGYFRVGLTQRVNRP